jgi:cytoskeletal protein CcmA (bactofilin family)
MTSIIAENTVVTGRIAGDEDLLVEGTVEGQISTTASLEIAPGGFVTGTIEVARLRVDGSVDADEIIAGDFVHLGPTSNVRGKITAQGFRMEEGAAYQGELEIQSGEPRQPAPARTEPTTRSTGRASSSRKSSRSGFDRARSTRAPAVSAEPSAPEKTSEETSSESEDICATMTVKGLREKLKSLDLPISGTKADLVVRLREHS